VPSFSCAIQKALRSLTLSFGPPAATAIASKRMVVGPDSFRGDHNVMPLALSISITPWASVTVAFGSSASTTQLLAGRRWQAKPSAGREPPASAANVTCPVLRNRNHILPRTPK
jgi:hypothetical protein